MLEGCGRQDAREDYVSGAPAARTLTTLRDPSPVPRGVTYLDFHPDGSRRLAVAYSVVDFQRTPPGMPIQSYVWDMGNPNAPEMALQPGSQLLCLKFNLKDSSLLGGGMYNGQFGFFDVRRGPSPVEVRHLQRRPGHPSSRCPGDADRGLPPGSDLRLRLAAMQDGDGGADGVDGRQCLLVETDTRCAHAATLQVSFSMKVGYSKAPGAAGATLPQGEERRDAARRRLPRIRSCRRTHQVHDRNGTR